MEDSLQPRTDTSGSSADLDTFQESFSSDVVYLPTQRTPQEPSHLTLRSQCAHNKCPLGEGINFRSRISPSPSKQIRSRRRRRSDQSRLGTSSSSTSTLDVSNRDIHLRDRHNHTHRDHHTHLEHTHNHHENTHHLKEHHELRLDHLQNRNGSYKLNNTDDYYQGQSQLLPAGEMVDRSSRIPPRKIKDTNVTSRESKITVSHTGVSKSSNGGPQIAMNGGIGGFAQSVKTSVLGFLTPSKEKTLPVVVESPESEFEKSNSTGERVVASSPASETFMSAREFFAKADLRDRLTSDYFSGTDTPSKLRV
nr:lateral signaling target protein 2 homolog isoform X2 [Cherax quadricarinatus]